MRELKVLVAEDYASARNGTVEIIQCTRKVSGVLEASDGRVALEILLQQDPAIAFIDTNMPFLAGYEVIKEYRRQKPEGQTVFVMMSCFPEHYEAVASSLNVYFMKKPYDINELRDRITRIAERIARQGE
jgi:YesN/AraC family two-component response regulator